jgi:hypothetical protein
LRLRWAAGKVKDESDPTVLATVQESTATDVFAAINSAILEFAPGTLCPGAAPAAMSTTEASASNSSSQQPPGTAAAAAAEQEAIVGSELQEAWRMLAKVFPDNFLEYLKPVAYVSSVATGTQVYVMRNERLKQVLLIGKFMGPVFLVYIDVNFMDFLVIPVIPLARLDENVEHLRPREMS